MVSDGDFVSTLRALLESFESNVAITVQESSAVFQILYRRLFADAAASTHQTK